MRLVTVLSGFNKLSFICKPADLQNRDDKTGSIIPFALFTIGDNFAVIIINKY